MRRLHKLASPVLALALGVFLAASASGQGILVTVDRVEATVEDQLVLTVTVEGSQTAQPRLPDLSAFEVYPRGQSSQMEVLNGRMKVSVRHNFVLVPKQVGTFTVGVATVAIDGETYRSDPFTIRIVEAQARPQNKRELFLTARVSNDSPFVGEQVIYTWRFYRRVRIADARLDPLEFDGFVVEDLGEVKEFQTTLEGQTFVVSEFRKALFPQEDGTLTISPSQLHCQVLVQSRQRSRSMFDDFFGRTQTENRVLRTSPIEVKVKPLPPPPHGFTGLVGSFDLSAKLSKAELKVGESATLEMTVSGTGNVQQIPEPPFPELPAFKIYDDKPSGSVQRSGNRLTGKRTFRKALVPLEPGEHQVPSFSLPYFDPEKGQYRNASTGAIMLSVSPADGKEELRLTEFVSPDTGKVSVRILADDILPLRKGLEVVAATPLWKLLWPVWLFLPPMGYLGFFLAHRRRERYHLDAGRRRHRRALKRALATVREAARKEQAGSLDEAAPLASRAIRELVGDKTGMEGAALTPDETCGLLRDRGMPEELSRRTQKLLENLEAVQYGVNLPAGSEATSEQVRKLLKELDGTLKDVPEERGRGR